MEYGYKVKFKNPSFIVCIMTEYSADVMFTCNERRKKKDKKMRRNRLYVCKGK